MFLKMIGKLQQMLMVENSMENLEILPLTQKEFHSVTVMTREFFPYTGFDSSEIHRRAKDPNITYLVAKVKGQTVGFIDWELQGKRVKLMGLAVLQEFRKKGIARNLVREALRIMKEKGTERVYLLVAEDNTAAQNLYKSFGFTKQGLSEKKLWDKKIYIMEKTL